MDLSGGPPGTACDMFVLQGGTPDAPARGNKDEGAALSAGGQDAPLNVRRVNQSRYQVSGPLPPGGLLLFSESFNSRWLADAQPPLKAYGFMNAYVLPKEPSAGLELVFSPQRMRVLGDRITLAVWGLGLLACLCCAAYAALFTGRFPSGGKQGSDTPTP